MPNLTPVGVRARSCIGKHTLNTNDLVAEIKEKLFGEKKGPRYLFSEHIFVDTCGCYTRDELVKKAVRLQGKPLLCTLRVASAAIGICC